MGRLILRHRGDCDPSSNEADYAYGRLDPSALPGSRRSHRSVEADEELRQAHRHGAQDRRQHLKGDPALTPLQASHVGPVNPGPGRKLLLGRDTGREAQFAKASADSRRRGQSRIIKRSTKLPKR
jgi:hypothetical protein